MRSTGVRPKRFYLAPGERTPDEPMYRVEAIYEHDGWRNDTRVTVPEASALALARRPGCA